MALDLGFGFNDANFSDRILRIVILPDDHHHKPSSQPQPDQHDDGRKQPGDVQQLQMSEGINHNCVPIVGQEYDQEQDGTVIQIPKSKRLEETKSWTWSLFGVPFTTPLAALCKKIYAESIDMFTGEASQQKKYINVNSLILAGQSQFFRKLFSNGMKESGKQKPTIHIEASEEAAFIDLLEFMYSGKLSSATPTELLKVLIVADKFDVPSCIKLCGQLLKSLPMTPELALVYLDLESTGLMVDYVKPLFDSSEKYLAEYFADIKKANLREEFLRLPLVGVESVLSSHSLQINSEDDVYDLIQNWVQTHYQDQLVEKRKILNMLLRRFLRFPFISFRKLTKIVSCKDIDPDVVSELALGSLAYHLAQPRKPRKRNSSKFIKRAYKFRPLKSVALDSGSSHPHSINFIDFERDELGKMSDGGEIFSQNFFLGKHEFAMCARRSFTEQGSVFGLHIAAWTQAVSVTDGLTFTCEIAIQNPSGLFVSIVCRQGITMPQRAGWSWCGGMPYLVPWATLMAENSPYFINGILRLRCHLTKL